MTTRLAHVADSVGADAYSLQEMTEQESLELITKRMQKANEPVSLSSADRSEALTLIAEVGSHPLALELVGALVSRHYNWSETRHQLLIEQSSVEPSSDYVGRPWQKIEACLSLSLRYLQREDPIAWKSILWLSLLPPKQEINEKMAAHIWRTSYVNAERILGTLYDDALITKVDNGFTIHDLMHGMTRRVFPRPIPDGLGLQCEEGHATIVDNYFQLVGGRWDQLPDDGYAHSRLVWHLRACRRFDAIRSLLKEEDSNGQSMWYAKRVELGQTSGYLEDIRIVQSSEHRSDGDEISDAFLWALIVSSIKSVSSNIHPDVFTAIVARGLWSPARAFQWIVEVGRDDLCSEYFVSFVSGVDMLGSRPNVEIRQAQRLRAKSLLMGRQLLLSAPATKSSIRIMVKLIILLDHNDKLDAARQAYIWCKGANDKLEFLANLPTDLKRDFVGTVADMVLTSRDSSEKVQQIAKLIPILHETRRYSALTALFDVMERLIQAENDSEGTPEEHSLSSQSGTEGFKVSLGWPTSEAQTATRGTGLAPVSWTGEALGSWYLS
jgi:hypothetical protein